MYSIRDRKNLNNINFTSIKEIDKLVNTSFDSSKEITDLYNNKDLVFQVNTNVPLTMIKTDVIEDNKELIELLEILEKWKYEINSEHGTYYDAYMFTRHEKELLHKGEKYKYGFILPDYNINKLSIYVSNNKEHYKDFKKVMVD